MISVFADTLEILAGDGSLEETLLKLMAEG